HLRRRILAPMVELLTIETPDGRSLDVRVHGRPGNEFVLFHHGTPGCGVPSRGLLEVLETRALRYVAIARPGYGGSTRRPGRIVAPVAAGGPGGLRPPRGDPLLTSG